MKIFGNQSNIISLRLYQHIELNNSDNDWQKIVYPKIILASF